MDRGSSSDQSTISSDSTKPYSPPTEASECAAVKNSETFRNVRPRGSRHKGVVPQPNGRWGAQIYEKNQRIWLGTYENEEEAAKAYNIAAQCFRGGQLGGDSWTMYDPDDDVSGDDVEAKFLRSHSKAEIVEMLRSHTYGEELRRLKQNHSFVACPTSPSRKVLFQKTLTPSDVGRQNRLVVPKKHAEKHFPVNKNTDNVSERTNNIGNMLNFRDLDSGKVWRFRFSYWNRSRSYVLTRGWSRFIREKKLEAGDLVSFQRSNGPDRQLYVDYSKPVARAPMARMVQLFGVDIVLSEGDEYEPSNSRGSESCTGEKLGIDSD